MSRWLAVTGLISLIVLGFACAEPIDEQARAPGFDTAQTAQELPDEAAAARDRAEEAATTLGRDLKTRLLKELQAGSPAQAIAVCSEIAPDLARALSTEDLTVRRTSLRVRNPSNAPDSFERAALQKLEASLRQGLAPADSVDIETTAEGRQLRLLRPLVAGELCLRCHGAESSIDRDVGIAIASRYPEDQAVGYEAGDLRGAISVTVRLD